jgi:hypothetical protein
MRKGPPLRQAGQGAGGLNWDGGRVRTKTPEAHGLTAGPHPKAEDRLPPQAPTKQLHRDHEAVEQDTTPEPFLVPPRSVLASLVPAGGGGCGGPFTLLRNLSLYETSVPYSPLLSPLICSGI